MGYNVDVIEHFACLAVDPAKVHHFAYFFNCTPVDRSSDPIKTSSRTELIFVFTTIEAEETRWDPVNWLKPLVSITDISKAVLSL